MTSLGDSLRQERLRRNLDYDAISRELKISPRILQAIEEEQFGKLPGGVFAKGFVRQYARMLGLDEEEAVAAAQHLMEPAEAPSFGVETTGAKLGTTFEAKPTLQPMAIEVPRMDGWEAVSDRRRLSRSSTLTALALVVGVMLVCSLVYGWWVRDRHTVVKPAVAAASTPAQSEPVTAPAPTDTAAATPEMPKAETPQNAIPAAQTTAEATQAPAAHPEGPVHVELTATEPVWVTAHSDGKYAFSGVIEANQTKTLDASESADIKVGNAGGVRISLNGKPIGEVGPRGQVRTIQFTSGGFHIVVAAPKPSDPIGLR